MSENYLVSILEKWSDLKKQVKEINALIDEIETDVKNEMDARKIDEMSAGGFNVFYKPIVKNTFDSKRFGAEHPELKDAYTVEKSQLYFAIKKNMGAP